MASETFCGGFLQGFQLVFLRNHGTNTQKVTDNNYKERQVEGEEVEPVVAKPPGDMSLEPATRDVSLQGEQLHKFAQPLESEVGEQPKHVPPVGKTRLEGGTFASVPGIRL